MSNPYLELLGNARTRLAATAALATVPILSADPKDPRAEAYLALYKGALPANEARKSGICVVLRPVAATVPSANEAPGVQVETLRLAVAIYELVPLNRDAKAGIGIGSLDVLWAIRTALQGWAPWPGNLGIDPMTFDGFDSQELEEKPGLLLYVAEFLWTGALSPTPIPTAE